MDTDALVDSIMAAGKSANDWTPFERGVPLPQKDATMAKLDRFAHEDRPFTIWMNNRYQVALYEDAPQEGWPPMYHLSIKRRDKQPIHDWRDLQRIKNELVGPEHEAIEIYPAESRLVDTANQYHLWVFKSADVRVPVGFSVRMVSNTSEGGSVQRPFPVDATPGDCMSVADWARQKGLPV